MSSDTIQALSVRDLVRRRRGDDPDVWHLALVQRDIVWDQVRMRYLLDSLLEGYPIGSLLVCQITGDSRVIRLEAADASSAAQIKTRGSCLTVSNASTRFSRSLRHPVVTDISTCT